MRKLIKQWEIFIQGFLLINAIWLISSIILNINVVPNPIDVYKNLNNLFTNDVFLHVFYSLKRIAIGLILSLLIGVPIGIGMAYSKVANRILFPLIYFSYPIPKTALLPIAMVLFGMRDGSKILIMFLIIVFQVIISVRDSVNNIDSTVYQVIKSVGANKLQILWNVTLPAILPQLLTSIRVSLGTAVAILFFVEGYGTKFGMGYYIIDAWSRINYIDMYIGIILISIVGFLLFNLIDFISEKMCRWSNK
ncbi:NitT/TauT family transport system permease protein [Sedimentibacter acidaminivorans]|jgi:NitT/TauT family transport system permease protein|uniref:NitT/TauT family transport system permease protein n=1 Tax=Sedimentibacter acidaminivorans TaxID=913099 RepID=A0ABS4GHI4_9FIRM|nr:ABC transporter permease [Sedimentibacter acidaminivorans]MBP1927157.1 NitT/TauT family transport system permease protein [Sedimentibacter acidaminivorans]